MPRDVAALVIAWGLVVPIELWFGASGFVALEPWRVATELAAVAVVAAGHARFAPADWRRSPLIPGLAMVGLMSVNTAEGGVLARILVAVGFGVAAGGVARTTHRWVARAPLAVAVVATLLGGVGSRAVMLNARLPGHPSVLHPWRELGRELAPFARSGAGSPAPRIVFLTIDTLRSDRLAQMRSWKRVAGRGRSWERAMSTSSWTLPSMASLATGLAAEVHGASARPNGGFQGLAPGVQTLPAELAAAGYTCAAVFDNTWLSAEMGFARGFHRFRHADRNRFHRLMFAGASDLSPLSAQAAVDRAIREADALPATGAFLWVHFLDLHTPYAHAEGPIFAAEGAWRDGLLLDDAGRQAVRAAYDREVALLDAELMRLLDHLEATGWMDDMIVLTADHGEEFWDHGGAEHGHTHHGEVLDVGIAVSAPGLAPGPGQGLASLRDVTSTARAVAGLPPQGIDLRGPIPADRTATAFGNVFERVDASARQGTRRVIARGDGRIELYDLATDPSESRPLTVNEDDPLVRAVRAIVPPPLKTEAEIDRAALEALGYLSP